MLWLSLHFPTLALDIFSARLAEPAATAVVVLQDNRVYLRNAQARDQGIEPGSTLATAHSIAPQLKYCQRDNAAEAQRLRALADALYRFSSHVSIQAPDCIVLEIGGSLKLFNSHAQVCAAAITLCQSLGHKACARVATTPWASIALARSQQQHLSDVPLTQAGLELAEVPPQAIERFANMGIYTLGPLLDLPTKQLGRRFGKALLKYLAQLSGDLPDPRKGITPRTAFDEQIHLLEPLRNKGELYLHPKSPMCRLALELQQWLITYQFGCEQLLWKFTSSHQEVAYLPVRFAKGRQNRQDFLHVSKLKLEQSALPEEIISIRLTSRHLTPWQNQSRTLFQNVSPGGDAATGELSELVDELCAKLGDNACRGIQSRQEHTPEMAWQGQMLNNKSFKSGPCHHQQHKRPLWLFSPPRHIRLSELTLLHGPERLQTQWWQAGTAAHHGRRETQTHRDYYIAQHRFGIECWVFVDPQGQWFLHGYFG